MAYEFSIRDKTLKGGKIHCYNDIREIAKKHFSIFFKRPSTKLVKLIFAPKGFLFLWSVPFTNGVFVDPSWTSKVKATIYYHFEFRVVERQFLVITHVNFTYDHEQQNGVGLALTYVQASI